MSILEAVEPARTRGNLETIVDSIRSISFEGLDETKGTERRIRILFAVGLINEVRFPELVELTGHSPGALSQDLTRLEKRGLITIKRVFLESGRRRTTYRLTKEGNHKLKKYLETVASCIELFEQEITE